MASRDNNNRPPLDYRGTLQSIFHQIIIPQLYVFLGCILLGAFRAETRIIVLYWIAPLDFKILILYLVGSLSIFAFYYLSLIVSTYASKFLLSIELMFISAIIFIGAWLLGINSISAVLLPVTFLTLPIVWYLRGGRSAAICVAPNFLVLLCFSLLSYLRNPEQSGATGYIVGFILHVFSVLALIGLGNLLSNYLQRRADLFSPAINKLDETQVKLSSAMVAPIRREFAGRFLPISIVVSVATAVLGVFNEYISVNYFAIWFSIVCLEILIFTQVEREDNLSSIYLYWIIQFGLLITLWWQALLAGVVVYETAEISLLMLVLAIGGLPWQGRSNLIFGAIILMMTTFLLPSSQIPLILGFLMCFLIIYLTRQSANKFIASASGAVYPSFVSRLKVAASVNDFALQLADVSHLLLNSVGTLVIKADAQAFFRGHGVPEFNPEDKSALAGIFQAIRLLPRQVGIIHTTTLDRHLLPSLYGGFGYLPQRLIYFKVEFKAAFANELLIGVMPAAITARLVDTKRIEELLEQTISLAKSSMDAPRKSGRGTHIFISPVRDMGGVGEEVNEIIHSVNNSTQEISRVVENLKTASLEIAQQDSVVSNSDLHSKANLLVKGLEYLEFGARNIAMSASDTKWIKEACYAARPDSFESIQFDEVFSEIKRFLAYRQIKSGNLFGHESAVKTEIVMLVANRELLEACLRAVVRVLSRGRTTEGFKISHLEDSDSVGILFSFSGNQLKSVEELFKARKDEEVLKALQNFMFISDAELRFSPSGPEQVYAELILKFKKKTYLKEEESNRRGWALLVDDKAEIVNFYSSVADALGLSQGIATNLAEARALIKSKGEPGIVVTDIQLDQENGLELVKEVRDSFGSVVPIIVVSGNVEENLRAQVFASGASRYLTKPVGRKKLFLEIQELLNES
jgi:CheY-like chemotaxis protein